MVVASIDERHVDAGCAKTVATALWPYAGFAPQPFGLAPGQTISVPFGYSPLPDPLLSRIPRRFVERARSDVRLWREHDAGRPFSMLEQTETLAENICAFADSDLGPPDHE